MDSALPSLGGHGSMGDGILDAMKAATEFV
jgi:hypothetical protein